MPGEIRDLDDFSDGGDLAKVDRVFQLIPRCQEITTPGVEKSTKLAEVLPGLDEIRTYFAQLASSYSIPVLGPV